MKHTRFKNRQTSTDSFTDVFKLVFGQAAGSDNTTAGTGQTLNLMALAQGDVVFPEVILEVKTPAAGATTLTGSVGITGAVTQFTAASDLKAAALVGTYVPPGSTAQYPVVATNKFLVLDLVSTGANISALTAGEVWVHVRISRVKDRLTNRQM